LRSGSGNRLYPELPSRSKGKRSRPYRQPRGSPDNDRVILILGEVNTVFGYGKADSPVCQRADAGIVEINGAVDQNRCGIECMPLVPRTRSAHVDYGLGAYIPCVSVELTLWNRRDTDPVMPPLLSPKVHVVNIPDEEQVGVRGLRFTPGSGLRRKYGIAGIAFPDEFGGVIDGMRIIRASVDLKSKQEHDRDDKAMEEKYRRFHFLSSY
jgi:hypothetical protein